MYNSLKDAAIREYVSKIDWKRDNWNYVQVEEDMKRFLGERPTIEVKYDKDVMVNEVTGESKEFSKIKSIGVIYTDLDDKIKKVEILID
jgi:hypothetical protein